MSMYHVSRYSQAGQVSTVDTAAITALYVDSIAAYVEAHAPAAPAGGGDADGRRVALQAAGGETHNPLNSTVSQAGVVHRNLGRFTVDDSIPQNTDTWEDARRARAIERGYEYVAPTNCMTQSYSPIADTDCLRTDAELARICGLGFKHFPLVQRWVVLHDLSRSGQQGFTYAEFSKALARYGVKGCDYHNTRLLKRGHGFYWRLHDGMIYPVGYVELVKRAVRYAHDLGLHDLYLYGNHPGQRRDMYISVSGSGADFEGAILAAWYGLHGCPTISRFSLSAILARDARSIRRMERRACIRITYNEAQTTDPAAVPLNADGSLRGDVRHENGVWTSRLPNTYTPRMTRQHHRRGQGRKAACWFKHWLSSDRLPGRPQANAAESGMGKLNCIWRTYCETDKALNASRKRGVLTTLYVATQRQHRGRVWKVARNEDI